MTELHAWYLLRAFTFLVCAAFLAVLLGGCNLQTLSVNGEVTPQAITLRGSALGTWNQTPHGGSDEKSNSAPSESTESIQ